VNPLVGQKYVTWIGTRAAARQSYLRAVHATTIHCA
jgi:hypothetical protein